MISLDGYDVIRKDRSRNGGGVCIYLRSSINYKIRKDLVPPELEAICVEIIKPHSKPFLVTTVGNLEKIFLDVLDKHAPLQHKKIRSKKAPWITNDIKNLVNTTDRFKRKTILTNNENDWLNFRTTRNKVNIKLRNARKDYYSKKDVLKGLNWSKVLQILNCNKTPNKFSIFYLQLL